MSNLNVVSFAPNIPQQLSLREVEGQLLTGRFADQVYFQLSDGRGMVLDSETAAKLNLLELRPGEAFSISKQWDGNPKHPAEFTVWLTPQAERARAAAERDQFSGMDLEDQLQASIDALKARAIPRKQPTPERRQPEAIAPRGTGTHGPVPQTAPAPILAAAPPSRSAGKIPYNIACREIVSFVTAELKASGEQWNDQAKQDLVSTFIIAASKAGMLQVWERGESR